MLVSEAKMFGRTGTRGKITWTARYLGRYCVDHFESFGAIRKAWGSLEHVHYCRARILAGLRFLGGLEGEVFCFGLSLMNEAK